MAKQLQSIILQQAVKRSVEVLKQIGQISKKITPSQDQITKEQKVSPIPTAKQHP